MAKERAGLNSEAVKIDGTYIEDLLSGYATLKTTGREFLPLELDTFTVGNSAGEEVKSMKYPARIITVSFLLTARDNSEMRAKLNHLSNLLSMDEADFVFNDEADKFYTGVPILSEEIERGQGWISGSWQIYCVDPFKYSVAVFTAVPVSTEGNVAEFIINYGGTYPSKPVLLAEFSGSEIGGDYSDDGDCGFIAFIDSDENIIQLGNPDAIDLDAFTSATQLINRQFTSLSDWNMSGGKAYADKAVTGSVSVTTRSDAYWNKGNGQTLSFANPSYGTGSGWHGPILWKGTTGAINFDLSLVHRLCVNKAAEIGSFECGVYNVQGTNLKMVAGIVIEKTSSGTSGMVKYIIDDKVAGTSTIDLSYYNTNFGYCKRTEVYKTQYYNKKKKKWQDKKIKKAKTRKVIDTYTYTQSNLNTSIKKAGSSITFKVGNLAAKTFTNTDLEMTPSHRVSFHFGKSGNAANMHTNCVNSVRFTNNPSDSFSEIPNVFTAGDIVEADTNDASVYIKRAGTEDGHYEPQYGALGNDWEDFKLQKGVNNIEAVWSEWVNENYAPNLKIMYNEVFL